MGRAKKPTKLSITQGPADPQIIGSRLFQITFNWLLVATAKK